MTLGISGGSGEIRTHERLPFAGFQDRCNRPLCHASYMLFALHFSRLISNYLTTLPLCCELFESRRAYTGGVRPHVTRPVLYCIFVRVLSPLQKFPRTPNFHQFSKDRASRSCGNSLIHSKATATVPKPPSSTEGTAPNRPATMPDSNSPN